MNFPINNELDFLKFWVSIYRNIYITLYEGLQWHLPEV